MSCDKFQIEIEQRLHGALEDSEGAALEAHLAACPACQAYEATARRAETTMTANAEAALHEVDWDKVERGMHRQFAQTIYAFGAAFLALLAMNAAIVAVVGLEFVTARDVLATLLAELALPASVGVWATLHTRRMLQLKTRDETLSWLRGTLDSNIKDLRLARWVILGFAAIVLGVGIFHPGMDLRRRIGMAAFFAICLGIFAFAQWIQLPRAVRARAELE